MTKTLVSTLFLAATILSTGCATQPNRMESTENMPEITDVTPVAKASPNWCVRNQKRYDCGNLISVIRANGAHACRPANAAVEPGEKLCAGFQ